jgi:hypothetical protein
VTRRTRKNSGGLFEDVQFAECNKSTKSPQPSGGLMSNRLDFDIDCPNNHNQTVTFSEEEFEDALKSGALLFHCNTCDTDWPPTGEEILKFRKQFSKSTS